MLRLQKATVVEILRWASSSPDVEVCGLVWATERGQTVHPLKNVHPEPATYYRTAPKDVRDAFTAMDEQGGEPLAWYHSHPGGKPDPSEEDMAGAFNVGMHYLIAYPWNRAVVEPMLPGEPEDRVWRLSTWECLEIGMLLQTDCEVTP